MFSFTCFTKVHWVHSHIMKSPELYNWMNKFRVPSILNEFSPKNGQFFGTENHRNQGAACPERSRCTLQQHAWNWAHHEGWKVPDWLIQGGLGCGFDISTKWLAASFLRIHLVPVSPFNLGMHSEINQSSKENTHSLPRFWSLFVYGKSLLNQSGLIWFILHRIAWFDLHL